MLSRAADSVFWLARYLERAENVARFIEVNRNLSLGFETGIQTQWAPLIYITGDQERFHELYNEADETSVTRFLALDERNPNSVLSCLNAARENARMVRETISTAMWEEINRFYHYVRKAADSPDQLRQSHEFLSRVKRASYTIIGATDVTMAHGEAWNFARMGRLIERADKTSRIIDVKYFILLPESSDVGTPLDVVQWSALLDSTTALSMYRRKHGRIRPKQVLQFLILDPYFPRSIRFCLMGAEQSLHSITGSSHGNFSNRVEQLTGRLRSELDFTSVDEIVAGGLHEFIDSLQTKLNDIGAATTDCFFTQRDATSTEQSTPVESHSQSQAHAQNQAAAE